MRNEKKKDPKQENDVLLKRWKRVDRDSDTEDTS
jgi:hypothetical protein